MVVPGFLGFHSVKKWFYDKRLLACLGLLLDPHGLDVLGDGQSNPNLGRGLRLTQLGVGRVGCRRGAAVQKHPRWVIAQPEFWPNRDFQSTGAQKTKMDQNGQQKVQTWVRIP